VLDSSWQRIEGSLAADAVVLDVGGWANPLARADWVIDPLPRATRQRGDAAERLHPSPQLQLTTRESKMLTPEERVNALFWTGRLPGQERIFVGESSFDEHLESPIRENRERLRARIPAAPTRWQRLVWQIRNRRLSPPHGTWR
jgi:hypothetical protein